LQNDSWYFGALIGRVANRIGHARFTLHNHTYNLPANDHGNTLHGMHTLFFIYNNNEIKHNKHNKTICRNEIPGGFTGFGDVIWTVKAHKEDSYITFTYDSQDNEEGIYIL